jgi:phosphoribosylpyrophosphate synthetase
MTAAREIKIFSGKANEAFAESVVARLGTTMGKVRSSRFNDGETRYGHT